MDDEEEMNGSWALNARRARKAREAPGRRRTPLDQKFARARAVRARFHCISAGTLPLTSWNPARPARTGDGVRRRLRKGELTICPRPRRRPRRVMIP
jgi:hypothetical protein